MTTAQVRRVVVVSAGLSEPSSTRLLADRLTEATLRHLADQGIRTDVQVVELRDLAHDITTHLLRGFGSDLVDDVVRSMGAADGLIAVTPIFTSSYSGLFKMLLDILEPTALTGVPVLLGATGGSERHSLALDYAIRPVFTYLHAVPVPTGVFAATSDWGASGPTGGLPGRIDRAARELARELVRPDRDGIPRAPDPMALLAGFDPSGGSGARRAPVVPAGSFAGNTPS